MLDTNFNKIIDLIENRKNNAILNEAAEMNKFLSEL